jgi:hypothetical protein
MQSELTTLLEDAPSESATLFDDHRKSLSARFRAVTSTTHRRLDAWMVEQGGRPAGGFRWSPATARRTLGNAALRRMERAPSPSIFYAVDEEITDQLLRCASGYAKRGSLADWLAGLDASERALVTSEATNWASTLYEVYTGIELPVYVSPSDAFYDVAKARTTLRGRRDLVVQRNDQRIILRFRSGSPGKSAGPGLRSDLVIDTLAHHDGLAPARLIGVWPEAGVCLAVDGTLDDLRAGARDLVRTAVVQRRFELEKAA